jgi:RimJ/RimL family protein N-acetyltransferase
MDDGPRSERVRLRFVRRSEAPLLRQRFGSEPGGFNDFGQIQPPPEMFGGPPQASGAVSSTEGSSGDLRDERSGVMWIEPLEGGPALGTIEFHAARYGPNPESDVWQIGIELARAARGSGYGAEAQRLLADWLFETTIANRVEAQTDVENAAEARSLERAGFRPEGVLRGAQFRAGAYHDLVVYSRLRSDPR